MVDKHSGESAVAVQTGKDEALANTYRPADFMPGADDGEGLLILSDGRLRKVVRCDGLSSRSFDASALKNIATVFSEVSSSLKVEIQFAFSNTDLSEPGFLARYRGLISTDSECIRWLSECSEQWFKQIYDSHQAQPGNQCLYLIVTFIPSPEPSVQHTWNGTEIHLPTGSLEECARETASICDGLSRCGIHPSILNRLELRMLLNEQQGLSELATESKNARPNNSPATTSFTESNATSATTSATASFTESESNATTSATASSTESNATTSTTASFSNSSTTLAMPSTSCGTRDGMLFGFNSDSNEPVLFNPFFRGAGKYNNNLLISGAPAFQSLAIMLLILRLLPFGVRFILLSDNVGRFSSYQFLAELLGPEDSLKVSLEDGSKDVINPFDLSGMDFYGRPSGDKIRSLLTFFDLILAPEGREELTVQEKALLDRLILRAYDEAFARATIPTMSEFAALIEQAAIEESDTFKRNLLHSLACGLSIFTKSGAYSTFLDGQTNIDLNKKLLICETKNISGPRYQKAVAYTLNQFIENEAVRGKTIGKRFALMVQPSTGLMMSAPGLKMLENFSCGTRQHAMMFGVASDQMKTLCSKTPLLVKHAQTKLFLPHESDELSAVKSELSLSNEQIQAINSFSLNDGSFKCCLNVGNTSGIAKLTLSPIEHWICTEGPILEIPKRLSKVHEIKAKYQGLKHAEALRMAVYSLSRERH